MLGDVHLVRVGMVFCKIGSVGGECAEKLVIQHLFSGLHLPKPTRRALGNIAEFYEVDSVPFC